MSNTNHEPYQILSESPCFPLLGEGYAREDYGEILFNACKGIDLKTNKGLSDCIERQLSDSGSIIGYGGYLEDRDIYRRSAHFEKDGEYRSIHLGLDIWAKAGTGIYAPIEGQVHSWEYNGAPYDYGATIILEHQIEQWQFHTIYGHLSRKDLQGLEKGKSIEAGRQFCHIGKEEDNGGWVPHLHFQIIMNMQGKEGDYPGVAPPSEKEWYAQNCPDPALLFTTSIRE